jgi:hypothetical protein
MRTPSSRRFTVEVPQRWRIGAGIEIWPPLEIFMRLLMHMRDYHEFPEPHGLAQAGVVGNVKRPLPPAEPWPPLPEERGDALPRVIAAERGRKRLLLRLDAIVEVAYA